MKNVVRLTEGDLRGLIESSVRKMLKEYGDTKKGQDAMGKAAKRAALKGDDSVYHNAMNSLSKNKYPNRKANVDAFTNFQKSFEEDENLEECGMTEPMEEEELTDGPANNLVGEGRYRRVNESQLFQIIKESVMGVLNEIGDTHRFGQGKYGLAMDAASKARALGRNDQAANIMKHGAQAFNDQYGIDGFEMDDYGQLRHYDYDDNKERMYRPDSKLNNLKAQTGLQGGQERYDSALRNNAHIRNKAMTAKAFPRKKMQGGLNAVNSVDSQMNDGGWSL